MIPINFSANKQCLYSAILLRAPPCNFSCISFDPCAKTWSKHGTTECKRSCSAGRYWVEGAERTTKHESERLVALPSLWFHKYHVLCPKNRVIARLRNCPRTLLLWFLLWWKIWDLSPFRRTQCNRNNMVQGKFRSFVFPSLYSKNDMDLFGQMAMTESGNVCSLSLPWLSFKNMESSWKLRSIIFPYFPQY